MNMLLTTSGTEPAFADAAAAQRPDTVRPPARILYVEDEAALRRIGGLVLSRSGYRVDTAADGAEALAALNERSYSLLITDREMPRLTGLELVAEVRRAGMQLPIVMTSGSLGSGPETDGLGASLIAFLPKPFTVSSLVETVEQILAGTQDADHPAASAGRNQRVDIN